MADFETILQDLEIPSIGSNDTAQADEPTDSGVDFTDTSDDALMERAARIMEARGEEPAAPPQADNKPAVEGASQETKEVIKPENELGFVELSKKAFLNESGEINSTKINDYFFTKGKSFTQFFDAPLENVVTENKPNEAIDPEKEYLNSVTEIVNTLPEILKDEAEKGFTPEQTLQRLINTVTSLSSQKEQKLMLSKEKEALAQEFKKEVEEIREAKLSTHINRNITELGSQLEGLIPNMSGRQVLDKIVLDPKYGGKFLDVMFKRDNPNFDKVPEAERKVQTQKWFDKFQANKRDLATVAEFGKAMFLVEQLPEIIRHAQEVGAVKSANIKESKQGAPSNLANAVSNKTSSKLSNFLGYDEVN